MKKIRLCLIIFTALLLSSVIGLFLTKKIIKKNHNQYSSNKHIAFLEEVYTKIQSNYWNKLQDKDLNNLFSAAANKINPQKEFKVQTKKELFNSLEKEINQLENDEEKNKFTTQLADIVLTNLQPQGVSRLYAKKDQQALAKRVNNQTEKDHYKSLEVDRNASIDEIEKKAQEKIQELEPIKESSPAAEKKYQEVKKAQEVLADKENKKRYDQKGIEPTFGHRLLTPRIFYIHLSKFSPTTLQELEEITKEVDQGEQLDTLILDLRNNIGGSIDLLPYLLGPFIGKDQYAHQFYHQGEKIDFKTKLGWMPSLVRYKKVIVLINENTQSSAEVMTAVLKKYNVGVVLGETSKGWGSVEKVFPLENQINNTETYSMFLVHSLTLREDGQPIQEKGVEPHININNDDWQKQFRHYYSDEELIRELENLY